MINSTKITKNGAPMTDDRLARATEVWARTILDLPGLPAAALVMVELARDAAMLADTSRIEEDGRLYLAAATRLQTLMITTERLASHDDGGRGSGDDWSDELARLLGSAPSLGDAANG